MKKNTNVIAAEKTLAIIKNGEYRVGDRLISVKDKIEDSVWYTVTKSPEELNKLIEKKLTGLQNNHATEILVKNCTTMEAIQQEHENATLKVGVLNFASAKNPGGGFLGGAQAQEESLARSSSLYASLTKNTSMYTFNKSNSSYLYSDYMIYSPEVVFWMNDSGEFLENYLLADVITSPAPNKGAMMQNGKPKKLKQLEEIFKGRIEKVLALALEQKIECLILGAWGCGVFRNDPETVAQLFKAEISGKFSGQFKKIVFAVFDSSKNKSCFLAFNDTFIKE
ncbi:MAG: Uncharacterized protein K0S33_3427 [Bacteroidetes bacterium]|jgi:uncharacterized protein (TIGR02452 family)|nr:Uncharacterized protein [Bacteroidota bacterium]